MAINLKFDLMGNPEPPSIVLANRSGNKFGQLNVNVESIDVLDKFNDASEFSVTLNKYIDGEITPYWDKVVDFKLVYCPEWDLWFEIKVELDEATETVKTVFCTQLGQAELSQIMLYNIEINTDVDIEREDFKTSILYDEKNPKSSILHRLLEKAPHYSIAYVDESIQRIQKQFSFDGVSICDAFNEIAEEIGCLFVYNSNSQAGGKPNRTISVYDLQQNCNNKDCKHRGEFTDKCPKCGSTDITYGYGEDTTIFVTADELATEGIQLVTDTESVKNCFKLEAGDDLMTATIRNCNSNGSDYIWYFSDSMKEDMSKELVDRIEGYDELYKEHYNSHISQLNGTLVNQYNNLVTKYDDYYNTKSTCLDCKNEGDFEEQCPKCNSKNILTGQKLQTIPTTITGYPALMTAYYNTIDLLLYLESGLMPNVEMSDTTAEEQVGLLTTPSLSPVAVNVKDIKNASEATANSAILSMAKVLIRPTYKVDVVDGSSSLSQVDANGKYKIWTGKFVVTNYSDDKDTATSDIISVRINNAAEIFIEQKIDKALNKENTDDYSIVGLFSKDYDDFCKELKKYALNPLDSFSKACDTCISILTEQGAGDEDGKPDLYAKLYKPYFDKQQAINDEIKVRESEIAIIEGVWDMSDENNPKCTTKGLQQYIEDCQKEIQDALNFEGYLGEDLWLEFCAYRREDKYSNSNYISDGLDNAELFKKANEFIEIAQEEIFKSAELQHSISTNLNNLLAHPKFKPLLKSFKTGNWIRVQVDDKVHKLRLLEYNFGYGDSKNIPVEFSDVTKIKNGTTDVQDVFEQASSMASSYDSVQRQAQKGNVARSTIDQWIVDGLNSANVQIQSNDNEEIVLTQSGLLARSYDDITGTYSPEQFKLTHNIMAYTDDNWETVSSALGKHNYKYWDGDGKDFVDATGYGLSAKFAQAAYVIGSQIIGGEIVSSNYVPSESGTYFNLIDGDFDIAGGKINYNSKTNIVTLDGVTIVWGNDSTNAPEIANISGLSDALNNLGNLSSDAEQNAKDYADAQDKILYDALEEAYTDYANSKVSELDTAVATHLGLGGNTVLGENFVISPYIGGGYLNITNADNQSRVVIDPNNLTNNGYIFQVHNGTQVSVGIDKNGNAEFNGRITATSLTIAPNANINGLDDYVKADDVPTDAEIVTIAQGAITASYIETLNLEVGNEIKMGSDATISWDNVTERPTILSGDDIKSTVITKDYIETLSIKAGSVDAENITGTTLSGKTISGGSITIGDSAFSVDSNGYLTANGALINGVLHAGQGSSLGGFKVDNNSLYKGTWDISSGTSPNVFMCTGSNYAYTIGGETMSGWCFGAGTTFGVTESGEMYCTAGKIGGWTIGENEFALYDENDGLIAGLFNDYGNNYGSNVVGGVTRNDWVILAGLNFGVSAEGGLYCDSGQIGGWQIQDGYLASPTDSQGNWVRLYPDMIQWNDAVNMYTKFISWVDLLNKVSALL